MELEELVTELEIHQVELELQNEELRSAQLQMDSALERYLQLFEEAPVAYLTLDAQGRIREANLRAAELLWVQRSTLIGTHLTRYLDERDADRFHVSRATPGPGVSAMEATLRDSGGRSVPVLLQLGPISGGAGVRVAITKLDRERAEGDRETVLRFQQLAEHVEDAFYVADTSTGKTLYASPAFERIFGTLPEELAWLCAVHPDDRRLVEQCFDRLLSGEPCDEEHRVLRPDGSERIVRHRAFLVEGAARVTGIVTDITEERALELELRQAQRMETLGALSSGIAHDFNNLLMGITGCAQMALSQLDPSSPARSHVQHGLDAALRGASITRQLMAFSRKRPVERRAVEVDAVAIGARELLASMVGSTIELDIDCGAPGARVLADTGDIEQILMNLATNARDAMLEGGTLSIRTELRVSGATDCCMVSVEVKDNGAGMDEETRRRLFEPFFTTKPDGRGTGLGMASVAALIARLGGTIDVVSQLGAGTMFTLLLPVSMIEIEPAGAEEPPPRGRGTVLVVENDALVRKTLGHYLQSAGYRTLLAATHDEAMRISASGERLDALVTDVLLPGRLGRDVARAIAAKHADLPVLFVSAHPGPELVFKGQVPQDALLLQKPFDQKMLAAALRDLFDERASLAPRRTVLLVDDSEAALAILGDYLSSRGYRVLASANEQQALALANENSIDALVTDFALGETTGHALAEQLRQSIPGLPVVLVSGSADVEVPPGGRFLQKPFELERLDQELEAVLRSR